MAYNQTDLTQNPHVISAKVRTTDLPFIGENEQKSSSIHLQDYVNAVVMNEAGQVLVLEGNVNGRSWSSWQLIGRKLTTDEDPMYAVQRDLLLRTGYVSEEWIYLSTFVIDDSQKDGAGYFFCAQNTKKVISPDDQHKGKLKLKWVTKHELKQALLDGRIAVINQAVAATFAMVMCNKIK